MKLYTVLQQSNSKRSKQMLLKDRSNLPLACRFSDVASCSKACQVSTKCYKKGVHSIKRPLLWKRRNEIHMFFAEWMKLIRSLGWVESEQLRFVTSWFACFDEELKLQNATDITYHTRKRQLVKYNKENTSFCTADLLNQRAHWNFISQGCAPRFTQFPRSFLL